MAQWLRCTPCKCNVSGSILAGDLCYISCLYLYHYQIKAKCPKNNKKKVNGGVRKPLIVIKVQCVLVCLTKECRSTPSTIKTHRHHPKYFPVCTPAVTKNTFSWEKSAVSGATLRDFWVKNSSKLSKTSTGNLSLPLTAAEVQKLPSGALRKWNMPFLNPTGECGNLMSDNLFSEGDDWARGSTIVSCGRAFHRRVK